MSEEVSISDKIKEFFRNQDLTIIKDEDSAMSLRKFAMKELKIKQGSSQLVKEALKEVLKEKGLSITGTGLDKKPSSGLEIKFEKPLIETPKQPEPIADPHGTMPMETKEDTQTQTTQTQLKPEDKEKYERIMKDGLGFLKTFYVEFGFIESPQKTEEIPKTKYEKFSQDVDNYSKDVADYLYEHNFKLPEWFQLLTLIISGVMVLGMPVINSILFGNGKKDKEQKKDKSLEKIAEETLKNK